MILLPLEPVRRSVHDTVVQTLAGADQMPDRYTRHPGDPGLFGPDSAVWIVHADLPSMLLGGISALFLQTLHPLAMAGVSDHSDFRRDPLGRLQRTGAFVATTTFAATPIAERSIRTVRRVHERVVGTTPDGRPYEANDPDLLRWVHCAEVGSFLRSYQRYSGRPLDAATADRYLAEVATLAERLGATEVPGSQAELRAYFRSMRPQLEAGDQALSTVEFLMAGSATEPADRVAYTVLVQAAVGLLPSWGREMLGLRQVPLIEWAAVRPAARSLGGVLRWAMGPSEVATQARDRCAAPADAATSAGIEA